MVERSKSPTRGSRTTVLLTGFGPFPGVPVNATMVLVPRLAELARRAFPDVAIETRLLPTEWEMAPRLVDEALDDVRPDLVLHFGVSGQARGFEIETRGMNVCAMAPDAAGVMPADRLIDADGEAMLTSLLPVAEIVRRLRARGIAAFASRDAGTYLCNRTLYHVLSVARRHDDLVRAGFVHVPTALAGRGLAAEGGRLVTQAHSPLSWEQALEGGLEIIGACLGRVVPGRVVVRRERGLRINRPA